MPSNASLRLASSSTYPCCARHVRGDRLYDLQEKGKLYIGELQRHASAYDAVEILRDITYDGYPTVLIVDDAAWRPVGPYGEPWRAAIPIFVGWARRHVAVIATERSDASGGDILHLAQDYGGLLFIETEGRQASYDWRKYFTGERVPSVGPDMTGVWSS